MTSNKEMTLDNRVVEQVAELNKDMAVLRSEVKHLVEKLSALIDEVKTQNSKLTDLVIIDKRMTSLEHGVDNLKIITEGLRIAKVQNDSIRSVWWSIISHPATFWVFAIGFLLFDTLGLADKFK